MTTDAVGVLDIGIGNPGAVANMLRRVGFEPVLLRSLLSPPRIVCLPGVGSFDHAMTCLLKTGLAEQIQVGANEGLFGLLGICLGLQLLGTSSEEGTQPGLGLLPIHSERLRPARSLPVPHMGWSHVETTEHPVSTQLVPEHSRFYFAHSYHVVCDQPGYAIGTAFYGQPIVAIAGRERILGVQFHPEKSHRFGMSLLRNAVRYLGGR